MSTSAHITNATATSKHLAAKYSILANSVTMISTNTKKDAKSREWSSTKLRKYNASTVKLFRVPNKNVGSAKLNLANTLVSSVDCTKITPKKSTIYFTVIFAKCVDEVPNKL